MNILITAKTIPDIDGVACSVALTHFLNEIPDGHQYFFGFDKSISHEAEFVMKRLQIEYVIIDPSKDKFDRFFLVDFSEKFGLPEFVNPEKVIRVIDHRAFSDYLFFPNAQYQVELIGAAATLIAEKYYFGQKNLPIDIANLLLCAIYSNTVNFKATNTTERDTRMKIWLEEMVGGNGLALEMFENKTKEIYENLEKVLTEDLKETIVGKESFGIGQLEMAKGEALLKDEKQMEIVNKVLKSKSVDYPVLIIQDITDSKTHIYSTNAEFYKLVSGKFEGSISADGHFIVPEITMRKVIIGKLKE